MQGAATAATASAATTTQQQQEQACCRQVETILSLLDADSTREYRQALELIPNTLSCESKVIDFLRVENWEPELAARRLARYWKTRKWLFGDRWLLPMTQTGTGAMQPREIDMLRCGYVKVVQSTIHGATFVVDFSLLPPNVPRFQPQVLFYLFSTFAGPATLLFVVRENKKNQPTLVFNGNIRQLLEATAVQFQRCYIAQAYEQPGKEHLLDFLGYQQRRFTETNFRLSCNAHIAGHSLAHTTKLLEQSGFERPCLPPELGGNLDRSRFENWIRMRLSVEEIMGAAPVMGLRTCLSLSAVTPSSTTSSNEQALVATTKTTRGKKKRGTCVTKKQIQRNKEYLNITRRPNETEQEFAKRRNALYVRRNYHRQKMEVLAAEGQVARYKTLNAALAQDNERLEILWQKAQELVKQYRQEQKSNGAEVNTDKDEEEKGEEAAGEKIPVKPICSNNGKTVENSIVASNQSDDSDDDDSSFVSILWTATDMEIARVDELA